MNFHPPQIQDVPNEGPGSSSSVEIAMVILSLITTHSVKSFEYSISLHSAISCVLLRAATRYFVFIFIYILFIARRLLHCTARPLRTVLQRVTVASFQQQSAYRPFKVIQGQ